MHNLRINLSGSVAGQFGFHQGVARTEPFASRRAAAPAGVSGLTL
jgi:hypothetical protein